MRKNTPKRAAVNRKADKLRRAFVEENPNCWVCGLRGVQCHEICQGCSRQEAILRPENYLALCPGCHELMHDKGNWPVARQMALAWKCGDYTMAPIVQACNEMLVRSVDEGEVAAWLRVVGM